MTERQVGEPGPLRAREMEPRRKGGLAAESWGVGGVSWGVEWR